MRSRVIAHDRLTTLGIHLSDEGSRRISRQFRHNMYRQVILTLGVDNFEFLCTLYIVPLYLQASGISDLASHFGVERRLVENDLIEGLAFLAHLAVTKDVGLAAQLVVTHELGFTFTQYGPVSQVLFVCLTTH